MLSVGSLFSGIGGLELGLEWTGYFETKWQVEIDPYARKVLDKHWPDVPKYGDITKLKGKDLEYVDLICGGFPCQDISVRNLQSKGLKGERSGLFYEIIRLVRVLRPRYLLLENVPAIYVRGYGECLAQLDACGYMGTGFSLSASKCAAPHQRERAFFFAYPTSLGREKSEFFSIIASQSCSQKPKEWVELQSIFTRNSEVTIWETLEGIICRDDNGVPSGMDKNRIRCLGNAVVPQVAQFIGECIKEFDRKNK